MVATVNLNYNGSDLEVTARYKKGKGSMGRDQPPDEDDVKILQISALDGGEMPSSEIGVQWDIERLFMEKIAA